MNDRTVRSLIALEQSASTARVLNLVAAHRKAADAAALAEAPMFQNRLLDRCLIVKHRLRPGEYELFQSPRPNVTKILTPIDGADLKLGARYVFVGQKDFDAVAESVFGDALKPGQRDREVLDLIDSLPSLDPFLLREHLKRHGYEPAQAYFGISDADIQKMHDFARTEVMALVALSFDQGYGAHAYASRLVEKLLSNTPDSDFGPLKETLKLSDEEYLNGVFSWRGFLYYKWVLSGMGDQIGALLVDIDALQPRGPKSPEAAAYLAPARARIQSAVVRTCGSVEKMLDVYNTAYAALTKEGKPTAFRDFLLSAPDMFVSLGEQLGAVQHIVSFWRFRFPAGRPRLISPEELMDVFLDFEDSMAFLTDERALSRAS